MSGLGCLEVGSAPGFLSHAEFEDTSNHRSTMAADAQENDSYSYEDRKNDNE